MKLYEGRSKYNDNNFNQNFVTIETLMCACEFTYYQYNVIYNQVTLGGRRRDIL